MTDKVSTGLVKAPPTPFAKERHRATGCDPVGRPGRRTLAQQRFGMPLDPHETRYLHDPIEQFARNDRLKYSDVAGDAWVIWSALVLALGWKPMRRYFELAGRPAVLVLTFLATVVLLAVFPAIPVGGELLDVRSGYGYDEAMAALAGYGAEGRRLYIWSSATLDTLLPVVYATFLAGLVYRFRPSERLRALAWFPVALGALDLCENAQIIAILVQFPDVSEAQVASASAFTVAKTFAFAACFAYALVVVVVAVARRLLGRRPTG